MLVLSPIRLPSCQKAVKSERIKNVWRYDLTYKGEVATSSRLERMLLPERISFKICDLIFLYYYSEATIYSITMLCHLLPYVGKAPHSTSAGAAEDEFLQESLLA